MESPKAARSKQSYSYINDLPNCSDTLKFRIFADTNVFASSRDFKALEQLINSELKKVKVWCDIDRLSINFSKTNYKMVRFIYWNVKIESIKQHPSNIICPMSELEIISRNNGVLAKLRHFLTLSQMKQLYYSTDHLSLHFIRHLSTGKCV